MTEIISQFFVNVFGDNAWLATFLIAIIPLIELKGAIPFGMSVSFWAEIALSPWIIFGCLLWKYNCSSNPRLSFQTYCKMA